ncbi:MAG: 2-oxoacid:ferredoxin oxidoreductase subunit beta [Bacillota bacterium]
MRPDLQYLFRMDKLPHIWCPGCGHGIITRAIGEAIAESDIDLNKTVIVSGIGCSSRASGYMNFDTLHTLHGRALAFATGVKLANPELNVFVITGDGDATAIGGNHFIHSARRNIDLNIILFNNNIYGMTGGQYSPLTPTGKMASTSPYGNPENNFDIPALAIAAGASYVARSTAFHDKLLIDLIKEGIKNKGFSLIEAMSMCPTSYGRRNKLGTAADMLNELKTTAVNINVAKKLSPDKLEGKFLIGKLHHKPYPEFTQEYDKLIMKIQKKGAE